MQTPVSVSDLAVAGKHIESAITALKRIRLPSTEIEVWQARLDLPAGEITRYKNILSRDEIQRADRFHFEHDRRRFAVARGILRQLLGRRLNISPAKITFEYMKHGKPRVRDTATQLHFNVSHSWERALYALSENSQMGVDIEYTNRDIDYLGVAKRLFTIREYSQLLRLTTSIRKRAFFNCWTRKEAIIKAAGDGLTLPLNQFEVNVEPDAEPRLLAAADLRIADWTLYAADVADDYVATVAAFAAD